MLTAPKITALKGKKKLVMLTAYDYLTASYLEKAGVDMVLVGDSLGMVFNGTADTLPVTVEDVIYHTKAVKRGAPNTMIVADMPFMSYQPSVEDALRNAGRIMKQAGPCALKLEGGEEIVPQVKAMIKAGIPVMGHIGLQPQSVKKYGGYPVMGKTPEEVSILLNSAAALENAGVFSIVLEKVRSNAAAAVAKACSVPIIGIGSGADVDGQVLVTHDMLGAFEDFRPAFVKQYEKIAQRSVAAVKSFASDVRKKRFPTKKYFY
ncbi:MAG: 3-methyl-2-oxobutanoate hydroxymethyltransferase [Spirochaetia bacterium]|nr:3-methyl-2-oxobutanoate hydroxymethyltransferase [Spirochaetia bacterium]